MAEALVDHDVLLKSCRYGVDQEFAALLSDLGLSPTLLPVARFVVGKLLERHYKGRDGSSAFAAFDRALGTWSFIEPDEDELLLAAAFEAEAQSRNLELDVGESQLLAILISRRWRALLTGDKRAVRAIEALAGGAVSGRLACLEQAIASMVAKLGLAFVRERVCSEPGADGALANWFACRSQDVSEENCRAGLRSHITDLRRSAPQALHPPDDLSGLVP
jgi:hypothetical protein